MSQILYCFFFTNFQIYYQLKELNKHLWDHVVVLTQTCDQHPGTRRVRRSSNGLSQRFCSVDATGKQILLIAVVPPEMTIIVFMFHLLASCAQVVPGLFV